MASLCSRRRPARTTSDALRYCPEPTRSEMYAVSSGVSETLRDAFGGIDHRHTSLKGCQSLLLRDCITLRVDFCEDAPSTTWVSSQTSGEVSAMCSGGCR